MIDQRTRYAIWATLPAVVILMLMWNNDNVDDLHHLQRVQPFVLMGIAKALLIAVMAVQHPSRPPGIPWWKVWLWVDPLVAMLCAMLAGSTIYFAMIYAGNSERFLAPTWGFDIARQIMWIDGYILMSVSMELLYRGIRSRRKHRMRDLRRYDITEGDLS